MNRRRIILSAAAAGLFAHGAAGAAPASLKGKRVLIAFYSRDGENWNDGGTTFLKEGNTRRAVRMIRKATGGELFEIETAAPYPADYRKTTEIAKDELAKNARPAMKRPMPDLSDYDVLILAHPVWWGKMPRVVLNFLEQAKLDGKTVIPFATHAGSGLGDDMAEIRRAQPRARVLEGLAVRGTAVDRSEAEIAAWAKRLGF